jgi:hypothetical protein
LGSKNRILLGYLHSLILHNHRNIFKSKKLYITRKKSNRISLEHPLQARFIEEHNFQVLLDNTIASCSYKEDGVKNFIINYKDEYLVYGISINNFRNELTTIFKPSVRQLIKCKSSINFFSNNEKLEFENYIKK